MLSVNFVFHVACFKLFIAFKFNKGKSSNCILQHFSSGCCGHKADYFFEKNI